MSVDREKHALAHLVLNRFGLGARPGSVERIARNPRAALEAELERDDSAAIAADRLPSYREACHAIHTDFSAEDDLKERELTARINKHLKVEIGFVERLVLFYSNHFSMSINKDGAIRATVGQLERDVIRRHATGSFTKMLIGVMQHPAMLSFLDNDSSIGPNSPIGLSWGAGLNHNLAREILELHTMGVGGGYSEADISALARVISGWSFVRGWEADGRYNGGNRGNRGRFIFRSQWHEPGNQRMLGKSYGARGLQQGEDVLADLADHPSTAQFLAFKLVRHFITDEPTPELVEPVARAFRRSRGNLKATARALIELPEAWTLPMTKLRTPYELQVAAMRAMERAYPRDKRWPFSETLGALRHRPWERGAPDGYPDESAAWMGPDAMRLRLETAQMNAWTLLELGPLRRSALGLADQIFGAALSRASRQAIAGASDLRNGLATLFMTPEFQRR